MPHSGEEFFVLLGLGLLMFLLGVGASALVMWLF